MVFVNQCLRHNLGYKQKIIQFVRRNQVYFSSSNVSTDTTVIVKDQMLNEKFTFCFKITIKWNLTLSHACDKGATLKMNELQQNE